jgi:hypothetical protein
VTFLETDFSFHEKEEMQLSFLFFCHEGKRKMKGKLGGKGDQFVTKEELKRRRSPSQGRKSSGKRRTSEFNLT